MCMCNRNSVYVSIYLTVSFTLERYISVCHPLRGQVLCTESRAKKVITGKYILSNKCFLFHAVFSILQSFILDIQVNMIWNAI